MTQILQDQTLPPVAAHQLDSGFFVSTVVRITFNNKKSILKGWLVPNRRIVGMSLGGGFLAVSSVYLIAFIVAILDGNAFTITWEESIRALKLILGASALLFIVAHVRAAPWPSDNFPIGQTVNFPRYDMAKRNSGLGVVLNKDVITFIVNTVRFGECSFTASGRFVFEDDTLKYMAGIGGATPQIAFPLLQRIAPSNAGVGASIYADTSAELYAFVAMLNHVHDLVVKDEPAPQREPEPAAKQAKAKKPEPIIEEKKRINPMD